MANRWASGLLMGLGFAGLCPMAQAQGVPGEPMPMNVAPGGMMPGGPMPMFGSGYGPVTPTMMPGMGDPGAMMGMPGMPGIPDAPAMNFGETGPNGMPGVGLPMGATYYPGISGCRKGGILDWLLLNEEGERKKFYGKIGYIGLRRNGAPSHPLISLEPAENNIDGLGDPTFGLTPFVSDFNDSFGVLQNGVQAMIGLQDDCRGMIFEVGGFYIENKAVFNSFTALGRLDSPYVNAPVGFQDSFGLWTNADFMSTTYKNSIYSGEANLRFFGSCWKTLDINYLIGFRYIKLQDSMRHYTIDDDLQLQVNDPTTRATLLWSGSNDMIGGQIGWSITQRLTPVWSVSWDQKIAFLCNSATTQTSLTRDDGFVGYDASKTTRRLATAFESGLFLEMSGGSFRLRGGYTVNFYTGVATAEGQFNYDLELGPTLRKTTDTVIYHGPSCTLEFVF